ncbi:MAG: 23S rRNA (pseudouridine(1915)-N(3))-methyltransferase RlmH [Clostridia bacterium]|nr:23S rRNA (pseudouridine(1915)-N(3))-methyltransferase RlmH [Clostridia bacterium]
MKYTILCMGAPKEAYYKEALAEYQKRMIPLGGLEIAYLKPAPTAGRELKPEEIRQALSLEAEEFRRALSQPRFARSLRVALCIEGKPLSSEDLARLFDKAFSGGKDGAVFLVGSSWGIDESVKAFCDLRLSFSPMTFAHALFQVMLSEQIYRAAGILAGSKYHK